jgi:hypothetical protein
VKFEEAIDKFYDKNLTSFDYKDITAEMAKFIMNVIIIIMSKIKKTNIHPFCFNGGYYNNEDLRTI